MKRFVLFDHDGVLVDTEPWYFAATEKALADIGFRLDKTQFLEDMKHSGGSWFQAVNAGIADDALARARTRRNTYYREFVSQRDIWIPGVVDVLRELQPLVRMAIVTTSTRENFEFIHRRSEIVPFMEFVLAREDIERPKPFPDPYLAGLERFGAAPEEVIVVEDSERGLRSAVAAGIDCAIVHNDFTATHDFTGATYRIGSLAELPQLVAEA